MNVHTHTHTFCFVTRILLLMCGGTRENARFRSPMECEFCAALRPILLSSFGARMKLFQTASYVYVNLNVLLLKRRNILGWQKGEDSFHDLRTNVVTYNFGSFYCSSMGKWW